MNAQRTDRWRKFHSGGVVPSLLEVGEGVVNRRGMASLGTDNLNKINEGRPLDSGAQERAPVIVIKAWDASDIYKNRKVITSILSDALRGNSPLRGAIKEYGS